jgi:hypothetical protein
MISDPAHVIAKNHAGDAENIVPLCSYHHTRELHVWGRDSFEIYYGIDLKEEARRFYADESFT